MPKTSSKSKKPLVSIIILTKNQKKYLEKTLPLLFKQTFKDFEVVIVDSGSTNGALAVMKKFPVKIIHTNQSDPKTYNYAQAFNEGVSASKGKFIAKLSGDAIPANKQWLENIIKGLEKKDVAGICGRYIFSPKADLLFQFLFRPIFGFLRDGPTSFTGGNFALKRTRWQEYHFNEKWGPGEDWEWGEMMKAKGYKILFNKKAAVFHEHRSGIKKQLRDIWWYLTKGIFNQIKMKIRKVKKPFS